MSKHRELLINRWGFSVFEDFETAINPEECWDNEKETLDKDAGLPSEIYLIKNWAKKQVDKVIIGDNATCREVISKVLEYYKDDTIDIGDHQWFEGFDKAINKNGEIRYVVHLGS